MKIFLILVPLLIIFVSGCTHVSEDFNRVSDEQRVEGQPDLIQVAQESLVPQLKATDFVGDWNVEGMADIQISLREDGTFSSFLNQDPMTKGKGTWSFVVGTLILDSEAFEKEIYIDPVRDGDTLMFQTDGGEEVWTKI